MANSLEQIQQTRKTFRAEGFPIETVDVVGVTYPYYVIPPDWDELPPMLPRIFAMQMVPDSETLKTRHPAGVCLFGVSGAVRQEFRGLVAFHEVYETVYLPMEMGSEPIRDICKLASIAEFGRLATLSADQRIPYLSMRTEFFAQLVPYAREAGYDPARVVEFAESFEFWSRHFRAYS